MIDGPESESASRARFASVDPWTREAYAEVALGGEQDADRAVRAARRAFDEGPWPRMGFAERGALLEADGGTIRTAGLGDGWVVLPTVVENAPPEARICREEVFGPVVTIAPFDDAEDAIRSANDTRYGLNAMVFTRDLSRAHRASAALRAGTVWVNCFFVRDLRAPFGGVGDSGIGREAAPSAASSSPSPRPWSCRSERSRLVRASSAGSV